MLIKKKKKNSNSPEIHTIKWLGLSWSNCTVCFYLMHISDRRQKVSPAEQSDLTLKKCVVISFFLESMFIFFKEEEITFQMHFQNFVWLSITLRMLLKDLKLNIEVNLSSCEMTVLFFCFALVLRLICLYKTRQFCE